MRIIAFGHRKRVGKNEATRFAMTHLRQHYPHLKVQVLSIADTIKHFAYHMYKWGGLNDAVYYHNHPDQIELPLAPLGKSPRQIWDDLGIYGRMVHPKTWIELSLSRMDADIAVCDSIRSESDIEMVRNFGGWAIKLNRDGAPEGGTVDKWLANYAGWDRIIHNNGTLRDLNYSVKSICDQALQEWNLLK